MKTLIKLLKKRVILAAISSSTLFLAGTNLVSALSGTYKFDVFPGFLNGGTYSGGYAAIDSGGNIIENSLFANSIVKYDKNGNLLWETAATSGDYGRVIVDSANNIYTDGYGGYNSNGTVYLTLSLEKISSAGAVLWSSNYIIIKDNEQCSAGPMAIGNNGSIYVVVRGAPLSQPNSPFWIARVNTSTGVMQKLVSPGRTGDYTYAMADTALALDSNNNVFYGGPEGILSYSADLSTLRWNSFSTNPTNFPYSVRAIGCDSGNNVYETGMSNASVNSGVYTMITKRRNNASGSVVWTSSNYTANGGLAHYPAGNGGPDYYYGGNSLAFDSSGNLYVAGAAQDSSGFIGGVLAKYNPSSGAVLWAKEITYSDFDGTCTSVAVDNYVHVAGLIGTGPGANLGTMNVFNTAGTAQWSDSRSLSSLGANMFTQVLQDNQGAIWVIDNIVLVNTSPIIAKYTEQ